jgi:Heavy metal associated domain 2
MDLAIRFPAQGRIHLESRFLFAEPGERNCRQFVKRVFQAPEITQVTIRSQAGSSEVPRAELGFCPRTYTLNQVVERIKDSLGPRKGFTSGVHQSNGYASTSGHSHTNGHVSKNGTEAVAPPSALEPLGVSITLVTPVRDAKGEIRYFRHGTIVTHWEIKHELPGRLRLKNPVIHRKAELCQAIERELMAVLGIDYFKTSPLTSTVLVQYDRKQLSRDQIIEILETALAHAENPVQKDKLDLHLPLCTASVPMAAIAQFAAPGLLPEIAQVEAEKRHQQELRQLYALERKAL